MPSPAIIRAKAKALDESVGRKNLTKEEREKLAVEKLKTKKADGKQMAPWMLGFLVFVVLGSSFLQIINNITNSPSMSDSH